MKNLRKDIPNEGRNNILMFLFGIAFLMIADKCTGQTLELSRRPNTDFYNRPTTVIFPSEGLELDSPDKKDKIYLSIYADSLRVNEYVVKLYAFFPKNVHIDKSKSITLKFVDGYQYTFGVSTISLEDSYLEYQISKEACKRLLITKFESVDFDNIAQASFTKNQDYFVAFMNSYCAK